MILEVIIKLLWCAMVMNGLSDALPTAMEKMTVSRMRMADLESSATGYTYNSQRGQPASYVQYTNHGTGGYYNAPTPVQYVTYRNPDAIVRSRVNVAGAMPPYNKKVSPLPGYVVPLLEAPKNPALAPYYVPAEVHEIPRHIEIQEDEDEDDSHEIDGDSEEEDDDVEHNDRDEEHGEGGDFNSEEQSSHGEKGEEGYKNHHEFNVGDKEEHQKDRHKDHYSDEGGNEKSHQETVGNYDHHDEAEKGHEGESYGKQSYHKKGQKTTGFHNVYRKNEYKKNTDFYDDKHKSGHYDKHLSSDGHHSSADGGYAKGDQQKSGYDDHEKGKAGYQDKGRESSQQASYKSDKGADSYNKNHVDYAAKSGADANKKYNYNNGHH